MSNKDLSPEFLSKLSQDEINKLLKEAYAHKHDRDEETTMDLVNRMNDATRLQSDYLAKSLEAITTIGGSNQAEAVKPPTSMAEELSGGSNKGIVINKTPDQVHDEIDTRTAEEQAKADAEERAKILEEASDSLAKLTGLKEVKDQVKELQATISANQIRKSLGMLDESDPEADDIAVHLALLGAPGTGKTTVARIYAKLLHGIGLLKKGHLVETDRSGLVAEYQGQTSPKTNKVIDAALDGVLFIDEAYNLNTGEQDTFGQEAIATLMKRMEDDRERLVVIIAGYTDVTEHFLDSNPGLRSRFVEKIEFPNYSNNELVIIAEKKAKAKGVILTDANKTILLDAFNTLRTTEAFANGRTARVLIDNAIKAQSLRFTTLLQSNPAMSDDEKKAVLSSFDESDLKSSASKTIDMSTSKQSEKSKMLDNRLELARAFSKAGDEVTRKLHSDVDTVSALQSDQHSSD